MKFTYITSPREWYDSLLPRNSTLSLILETMNRGHEVSLLYPKDVSLDNCKLSGIVRKINSPQGLDVMQYVDLFRRDLNDEYVSSIERNERDIIDTDALLWRVDPAEDFEEAILNKTLLRKLVDVEDYVPIINRPSGILKAFSKESLLELPEGVCPETYCTRDINELLDFFNGNLRTYIVKPSEGYGGNGVIKVNLFTDSISLGNHLRKISDNGKYPIVVQEFLDVENTGDKRVYLIGGEPVAAMLRMPAKGEFLANAHKGGTLIASEVSDRDEELAEQIKPFILKYGLGVVGMDVIDGKITELNVNCIGGFPQAWEKLGINLQEKVVDYVESELDA